jgi:hypothetical protein
MFPTAKTIQDIDSAKLDVADVVDNLTSTDTDKPLSANQGKVLQDGKEPADATILKEADIVDNLTSTSTTAPLSANQGKVLQDGKLNLSGGTMTGDLTIPDKIIHSGDTNTAIRFPANDTVTVETAGVERMRVTSAGDVGIGTTAPRSVFGFNGLTMDSPTSGGFVDINVNGSRRLTFFGDSTRGVVDSSTNDLAFDTNSTERLRITSAGNVGIGTTAPVTKLQVGGGVLGIGLNGGAVMPGLSRESTSGGLAIGTYDTNGSLSSTSMTILSAGDVGIGTTSPATKLDVSGSIRASTGILFGTDTASANTLSDYEEGTFDFGIAFGGASVDITYLYRVGKYTKIGRQVTVTGYILLTSKGTSTGIATITGLPFTVFDNTANYSGISVGFLANITFADYIQGFTVTNGTSIELRETTNAGVNTTLSNADFADNSQIILSLTYFTS